MKLSMKFKTSALLALPLWLGLSACGQVNMDLSPAEQKKVETKAITNASAGLGRLTPAQFRQLCDAKANHRYTADGKNCLTFEPMPLADGTTGSLTITTNFGPGKFLVATGNSAGVVDLVLSSRRIAGIPVRMAANSSIGSGTLAFSIYGVGFTGVYATVWTCYSDSNGGTKDVAAMLPVQCIDSMIP